VAVYDVPGARPRETRRLYMEEESPALGEILSSIAGSFSLDSETATTMALQYDDADGDRMTLSAGSNSSADVDIMLKELQPPYKLHVMLPQEEFDSHAAVPDSFRGEEHAGVYCVCCHRNVVGFRYKCLVCPDYDICARCEAKATHPGHDMIRICLPRQYPAHFFTRIHRLYERLNHTSSGHAAVIATPPGMEPMAKDLIDDESDLSDSNMEILDYPEDANSAESAELPSIEELTRHMQDLTDADKSDADLVESPETVRETVESVVEVESSEVAEAERAETAHEAVTGNNEGAPVDTIQNLQEEIDKLLAPLCSESETTSERRRERETSSPAVAAEIIVERAIVETDAESDLSATVNGGKRERPSSAASSGSGGENQVSNSPCRSSGSGATPSKCPRTADEVSVELEFDAIVVEEVTEFTNESATDTTVEDGEESDDEEEEEEEEEDDDDDDEKTVVESVNSDELKEEDMIPSPKTRENRREEPDNMELRRALHRAGIDSSLVSSVMSPTIAKYANLKESLDETAPDKHKDTGPTIDVEKEMAAANAFSSSGHKGYFTSPYSANGRHSHLSPSVKVSDARDKMLAMGFSDEDGWLTQLITMKRGNIDEVLDVLAPVKKS